MIVTRTKTILPVLLAALILLASASCARAQAPPIKLILSLHIGWEVDKTTKGKVCTVPPEEECQPGSPSSEPGGFEYPEGVAAAPNGNVYVADQANHRVQELTATGEFVSMFGREVNETTHGDICTKEEIKTSAVKCKQGLTGTLAGALAEPQSIAVDPGTENVYVQDFANWRIDMYTAGGQFVLMFGKEVNETVVNAIKAKGGTPTPKELEEENICTAASKDTCKAGVESSLESTEKSAFDFAQFEGDLLVVGGAPEHLLYVGDGHRIQEFDATGEWKGEIKLLVATISTGPNGQITAVAVDSQTENVYVIYNNEPTVYELNTITGEEVKSFEVSPGEEGKIVKIGGIALDPSGHLAVSGSELSATEEWKYLGYLYNASEGRLITEFTKPVNPREGRGLSSGIVFTVQGELYAAIAQQYEILSYFHVPVAELITGDVTCKAGTENETDDTFGCILNGEVNPYNVLNTEAWFEWGRTSALGSSTPKQSVETVEELLHVSALLEGLRPHETYYYQLAGDDQNVQSPEQLTGNKTLFSTRVVSPKTVGEPSASFVTSSTAIMFGELNPENTPTEYFFEYGPGETLTKCPGIKKASCPGVTSTTARESALYGRIGTTSQVSGLQPNTTYHVRLTVINENGEGPPPTEGTTFTTAPPPEVQAETGSASAITTTSAIASGSVNPDGQPATYTFQLGINKGTTTQYATIVSGPTGTSTTPEPESILLTGLQPGTEYAYRITIHSGYGTAEGAPATFTTTGVPVTLTPPAPVTMLPVPPIHFPTPTPTCKHGYTQDKHGKCIKNKKKTKTKGRSKNAARKKK